MVATSALAGHLTHVVVLVLRATAARALAPFAFTLLDIAAALASTAALATLHVGQTACFGVDVTDLLVALRVKCKETLTGGGAEGLLEVRVQALPPGLDLLRDPVVGIDALGLLGRLVLVVEVGESVGEAAGDAVLVVESDGFLDGLVADHVPLRQILGHDTRARLILLLNVLAFGGTIIAMLSSLASGQLVETSRAGDLHLRRSELGVVEKEGRLCSTARRERNVHRERCDGSYVSFSKVTVADLGALGPSDVGVTEREVIFPLKSNRIDLQQDFQKCSFRALMILDLPEAEEVSHFFLARVVGDVLHVNGG